MIKKFKRKQVRPNQIEAIQFDGSVESFAEIRKWVGKRFHYDYQDTPFVFLDSWDYDNIWPVEKGQWIVKYEEGHFELYASVHIEPFEEVK